MSYPTFIFFPVLFSTFAASPAAWAAAVWAVLSAAVVSGASAASVSFPAACVACCVAGAVSLSPAGCEHPVKVRDAAVSAASPIAATFEIMFLFLMSVPPFRVKRIVFGSNRSWICLYVTIDYLISQVYF